MDWLDVAGIVAGFATGWIGAMLYYGQLCSIVFAAKVFWAERPRG